MAHDVFISYASEDKTVADAVCAKLEANGVRCWIAPRDVIPGQPYGEAIIDAIHDSRIMILIFSSRANASQHIPKEIERAVSHGVTIMPFRIESVAPGKSLDYFIGSVHWLDAMTPPLDAHLQKLASNVQLLLSRGAPEGEQKPVEPPKPIAAPAANPWKWAVIGAVGVLIVVLLVLWLRPGGGEKTPATSVSEKTGAGPDRSAEVQSHLDRMRKAFNDGVYDEAVREAEAVKRLDPENATAREYLEKKIPEARAAEAGTPAGGKPR
jgi:hypothetical protein